MDSNKNSTDYAIIGAGISGLYCGWRLQTDSTAAPSIAIYEAGSRIGGRLLSVVPPNIPKARVELGGMRFIKDLQPWITALVLEGLQLKTATLPAEMPQNMAYVRHKLLRHFELTDPDKVPYFLRDDEKGTNDLLNLTATAAMRALGPTIQDLLGIEIEKWQDLALQPAGKMTEAGWRKVTEEGTFEGRPLWSLPIRYLILRSISHEGFRMAEETSGYDSVLYTWNAADGFPWNVMDYGPNVEYLHLVEGFSQVPLQLGKRFTAAGGALHLNSRLESFTRDSDGLLRLALIEDGKSVTHFARNLILAMPRRAIEMLQPSGPLLMPGNTVVRNLLESVTPIPLFKLAICYELPWFQDPELVPPVVVPGEGWCQINAGKSVTDLPIRQCFYWEINPENHHCVILIYDDGRDLEYWADLREDEEMYKPMHAGTYELAEWGDFPAPRRMVEEIHRQLLEMHGISDASKVPMPYAAAYKDWGEDPYGGGANFWHTGVKSYEVEAAIINPDPNHPVYIVGDCWSHAQGWVEGALTTSEVLLQEHLGLEPPKWKVTYDHSKEIFKK